MPISGQPDDPSPKSNNLTSSLTQFQVSGGSKVAAGPSTCGDWIVVAHHRTTGDPGQGVDGRLLCPVTRNPAPTRPPAVLSRFRRGCGKTSLVARTHEFFTRRTVQPAKTRNQLVTAGRDTKAQKGFVNPAVFHGSTVLYATAEDSPTAASSPMGGMARRRPGRCRTCRCRWKARNAPALASCPRDCPRSPPRCSRC
jgi:hypothetical protein